MLTRPARIPADLTNFRTCLVRLCSSSRSSVCTLISALATRSGPLGMSTGCSGALRGAEAIVFNPFEDLRPGMRSMAQARIIHKNYTLELAGFNGENQY